MRGAFHLRSRVSRCGVVGVGNGNVSDRITYLLLEDRFRHPGDACIRDALRRLDLPGMPSNSGFGIAWRTPGRPRSARLLMFSGLSFWENNREVICDIRHGRSDQQALIDQIL